MSVGPFGLLRRGSGPQLTLRVQVRSARRLVAMKAAMSAVD
ncbi:hypothetical protein [Sphingomonas daechungensis]